MSRTSSERRWIAVALAAAIAVVLYLRGRGPSSGGSSAPGPAPASVGSATSAIGAPPSHAARSTRIAARLAPGRPPTATTIVALPPPPDPARPSLGAPAPLSPEDVAHQRHAVEDWQRAAQRALEDCVPQAAARGARSVVQVRFHPRPRAADEETQVLDAQWIALPPHEQDEIARDPSLAELPDCLERLRSIALRVPLSREAQRRDVAAWTEHVALQR